MRSPAGRRPATSPKSSTRAANTLQAIELLRGVMPPVEGQLNRSGVLNARANLAGYLLAIDDIEGAVASARDAIHVVMESSRRPRSLRSLSSTWHSPQC